MAPVNILLDTNPYLRLAKSIHPLLGKPFGKDKLTLYIHKEIELELNRSSRLPTKFYWIEEKGYKENRKKKIFILKAKQTEIENTYDHIWAYQKENNLKLSREDIYCIATAFEMDIMLVTDDQDMVTTCNEFEVDIVCTLELMKKMYDNNHIKIEKIIEITDYWKYTNDTPANFKSDFKRLFSEIV